MNVFGKNKSFTIGSSFRFAVQIPDDSVGCSGSRCSNCDGKGAYCNHICRHCLFPLIGPFSFPQIHIWQAMGPDEQLKRVEDAYCHAKDRGRLMYANVMAFPLNEYDLANVEGLDSHDSDLFSDTHGVTPSQVRALMLSNSQ